jgi:hypothetical protein
MLLKQLALLMDLLLIALTMQYTIGSKTLNLLLCVPWHSLVFKTLYVHLHEVKNNPYFTSPNHNDRVKYKSASNIIGSQEKKNFRSPFYFKTSKVTVLFQTNPLNYSMAPSSLNMLVTLLFQVTKYARVWSLTLVRWDFLYSVLHADERIQSQLHYKNILWDNRLNLMTRIFRVQLKMKYPWLDYFWLCDYTNHQNLHWIFQYGNTIIITYAHRFHSAIRFLSYYKTTH